MKSVEKKSGRRRSRQAALVSPLAILEEFMRTGGWLLKKCVPTIRQSKMRIIMLHYNRNNIMIKCILRRAEPQDAPAIANCFDAAYRRYSPTARGSLTVAYYAETIALYQVWVALYKGQIIGGLVLIPKEDHMLLANIAVHPYHQGKGVGRALLELAEAEALDQDYRELRLHINKTMNENRALYKRSGWTEIPNGEQPSHRLSMKKLLHYQIPRR
jgi:N-acetylglutamate synthase-like GNAT family acetyltransferase